MVRAWGDVDDHQDGDDLFGFFYSIIRGIFEVALLSITAVFLLQHDRLKDDGSKVSPMATTLSKAMAISAGVSGFFSFIELCCFAAPYGDPGFVSVMLHSLFAGGRTAILVLGLVPKNVLKDIWVQYHLKSDTRGGVVIAMLGVLIAIDTLYLILAPSLTFRILCFPCYGAWKCCYEKPVKGLRRRAKMNKEVAGRLLDEDIEIGDRGDRH